MSFEEFWPKRRQYIGREVRLRGKAVFDTECPPPEAGGECDATGYLSSRDRDTFRAYEEKEGLVLHEGGSVVRCKTSTALGVECRGWRQGAEYVVQGLVRNSRGDEPDGALVIEVKEKEDV